MGLLASEISSATVLDQITVTEDLKDADGAAGQTVPSSALNPGLQTYTASSTVPGKYYSAETIALVAGAKTIDLTALPGLQANIDGTGLKVQVFRIKGRAGNGALTISGGAVSPYDMFGGADPIYPADCTKAWKFEFDDKLADIAAGAKNIDLAGTGIEQFDIEFILG